MQAKGAAFLNLTVQQIPGHRPMKASKGKWDVFEITPGLQDQTVLFDFMARRVDLVNCVLQSVSAYLIGVLGQGI